MLSTLTAFIIIYVCFLIFLRTSWVSNLTQARRKGLYPPAGKATLFDVKRLISEGEIEVAVQVYCDIFKTNRRAAKKAVEEMERSLKQ